MKKNQHLLNREGLKGREGNHKSESFFLFLNQIF
jgi:hypothetical protein